MLSLTALLSGAFLQYKGFEGGILIGTGSTGLAGLVGFLGGQKLSRATNVTAESPSNVTVNPPATT